MIITTEQTKSGRISIYADGKYCFSVSSDYWYSLGIYEEDDISEERLRQMEHDAECSRCCNAAYAYLSRRAHSEWELRGKLNRKYSASAVDFAVQKARDLLLLDDTDYAVCFAQELLRLRHYGPSRIRAELAKRGIARGDIDIALEQLEFSAESEIEQLLKTKYKNSLSDDKGIRKTIASLMRMGYDYGAIRSALREVTTEEVDFDET